MKQNADPKCPDGIGDEIIGVGITSSSLWIQRGFIRARQFVHNVVEFAAEACIRDMMAERGVITPLDPSNVFPSLLQHFHHLALRVV